MQVTCPCCNARFPIEAALEDAAARKALAHALALPGSMGDLLLRYVALFRPGKNALSWKRATKILGELRAMIDAGEIERKGRHWAAPHGAWKAALEQMLGKRQSLTLPLKGHGYLLEILAGMANSAEGKVETKRERDRQQPREERSSETRSVADIVEAQRRKQWDQELGINTGGDDES